MLRSPSEELRRAQRREAASARERAKELATVAVAVAPRAKQASVAQKLGFAHPAKGLGDDDDEGLQTTALGVDSQGRPRLETAAILGLLGLLGLALSELCWQS